MEKEPPKWCGWAIPEQVRQMMNDMYIFLKENKEHSDLISVFEVKQIVGETIDAHL